MSGALNESSFWILTALAGGRRHGYAIMQQIATSSGGAFTPKVTTLYAALERLTRSGAIIVDGEEIVEGRARRYFKLSDQGAQALSAEVKSMENRLKAARKVTSPMVASGVPSPGAVIA
ncbi:PadR family transcriptional regulator [Paeniglutamicibacter antarcticus]